MRRVLLILAVTVAVLSLALSVLSGFWNHSFGTLDWTIRVVLTVGLGALAVLSARTRVHREHDLRRMTVIAEAAQRALLRALPSAVGSVGFAARYLSATQEALVGGDLYEVAESPYGVRVIVGDVSPTATLPVDIPVAGDPNTVLYPFGHGLTY